MPVTARKTPRNRHADPSRSTAKSLKEQLRLRLVVQYGMNRRKRPGQVMGIRRLPALNLGKILRDVLKIKLPHLSDPFWERTEELRHRRDSLTQLRAETKKLRRQRAALRQYSKILASFTADRADRTGPTTQANMRRARVEAARLLSEIDGPSFFGELLLKAFGITEEPRNTAGADGNAF
jgi:hypothetical protein